MGCWLESVTAMMKVSCSILNLTLDFVARHLTNKQQIGNLSLAIPGRVGEGLKREFSLLYHAVIQGLLIVLSASAGS